MSRDSAHEISSRLFQLERAVAEIQIELLCHRSHSRLATKQDLDEMEERIMSQLSELTSAAVALSTASDALSVKVDNQDVKITALIAALAGGGVVLTPEAEAARLALIASTVTVTAAGDKVDAQIIKLDAALGTPAPGIPGAPVITVQPQIQGAEIGSSVTLIVTATGENLAYQWKLNNEPIAGATSSSFTIPSVSATDAGVYTVTVSNPNGSVTSVNNTLVVN